MRHMHRITRVPKLAAFDPILFLGGLLGLTLGSLLVAFK